MLPQEDYFVDEINHLDHETDRNHPKDSDLQSTNYSILNNQNTLVYFNNRINNDSSMVPFKIISEYQLGNVNSNKSANSEAFKKQLPVNSKYDFIGNNYGINVRKIDKLSTNKINNTLTTKINNYEDSSLYVKYDILDKNKLCDEYFDEISSVKIKKETVDNSSHKLLQLETINNTLSVNRDFINSNIYKPKQFEYKISANSQKHEIKDMPILTEYPVLLTTNKCIITSLGLFKGYIINGMMNGLGQLLDNTNFVLYDGGFKDNMFDGYGILYNPQAFKKDSENQAKSDIKENDPLYLDLDYVGNNWQKYEGIFRDNCKESIGFWHLSNADIFFGNFNDDRANGYGIYCKTNGSKIIGIWRDNKLINIL